MIPRNQLERLVRQGLRRSPIVALLGPRQCGKTTLARQLAAGKATAFDLENPVDARVLENPLDALQGLRGLVVLDEIQRQPSLFEVLRVLADKPRRGSRFLLLGSASPHLVRGISESLAGRVAFVEMGGFSLCEVGAGKFERLWLRGGLPRSFLASSEPASMAWRNDFIRTFLERDVAQLGIGIPAAALRRFWTMVAHFHGQVWNAAEFARSLGSSETTARRYLDVLTGAFVVRQLQPWYENISKRQVKSPKVYVRDSGLLHTLLSVDERRALRSHPKLGASWEGFAVEQVLALLRPAQAYFWATHAGAELDLMVPSGSRRRGFEMKFSDAPSTTRSMHVAISELGLDELTVVYPGERSYRLAPRIQAVGIRDLPAALGASRADS